MPGSFEDEIRRLVNSGDKIGAVKRYREETGLGLAEAKSAVEAIAAGHSPSAETSPNSDSEVTDQIISLLERGEKIQAVKLYRDRTGAGLKQAKDAVESIARENGVHSASGSGCLGMVLLIVSLAVTAIGL